MSAFGRRNGMGGGAANRPAFGVARPMGRGGDSSPATPADPGAQPIPSHVPLPGGVQFPPLPAMDGDENMAQSPTALREDAMTCLADRTNAVRETQEQNGFEASIRKIKEQVLPRLL